SLINAGQAELLQQLGDMLVLVPPVASARREQREVRPVRRTCLRQAGELDALRAVRGERWQPAGPARDTPRTGAGRGAAGGGNRREVRPVRRTCLRQAGELDALRAVRGERWQPAGPARACRRTWQGCRARGRPARRCTSRSARSSATGATASRPRRGSLSAWP